MRESLLKVAVIALVTSVSESHIKSAEDALVTFVPDSHLKAAVIAAYRIFMLEVVNLKAPICCAATPDLILVENVWLISAIHRIIRVHYHFFVVGIVINKVVCSKFCHRIAPLSAL